MNWLEHVNNWKDCTACPLAQQRSNICFARSEWIGEDRPNLHLPCDVAFIGEAPGASEDAIGLPFIGPAGRLMDQIIERALPRGVTHTLFNLVLCFPREAKERGDNEPTREEILACRPRLVEFVNLCQPKLIVTVGDLADRYVPKHSTMRYADIVHPAHILARLPQAQKGMATNKCIVVIRSAVEDVLGAPPVKFTKWEEEDASVTTRSVREQLRLDVQAGRRGP